MRESDRFEADRALKSIEQGMNDRRSRIHAEFRRALRSGDFEDVRDDRRVQRRPPRYAHRPWTNLAWRKEAQRAVSERDPETGLKITAGSSLWRRFSGLLNPEPVLERDHVGADHALVDQVPFDSLPRSMRSAGTRAPVL